MSSLQLNAILSDGLKPLLASERDIEDLVSVNEIHAIAVTHLTQANFLDCSQGSDEGNVALGVKYISASRNSIQQNRVF